MSLRLQVPPCPERFRDGALSACRSFSIGMGGAEDVNNVKAQFLRIVSDSPPNQLRVNAAPSPYHLRQPFGSLRIDPIDGRALGQFWIGLVSVITRKNIPVFIQTI